MKFKLFESKVKRLKRDVELLEGEIDRLDKENARLCGMVLEAGYEPKDADEAAYLLVGHSEHKMNSAT